MSDEDQRQPVLALQLAQQVEVLRLDGEIEAGRRLVGYQEPRLAGNAYGTDDALAHATRHLVRELRGAGLWRGDAHGPEQADRAPPGAGAVGALVHADRFADLVADGEQRIERGHRVLQDHGDALAAHAAHFRLRLVEKVLAFEHHAATDDARRGR